jgi:hypothetical protein
MNHYARSYLKKNFIKMFLLKPNNIITKTKKNSFNNWKEKIIQEELKFFKKSEVDKLNISINYNLLLEEVRKDLDEIFNRIKDHNLYYEELFDELYAWFTRARNRMGNQVVTCKYKFNAVCPPISIGILRMTSSINPKYRVTEDFRNKLFNKIKDLRPLNAIPISQAPLMNGNMPSFFIKGIWFLRSAIDQVLIKRLMKKKNPKLRYRLFKSLNWVKIYQEKDVLNKYEEYFSENNLGDLYIDYFNKLNKRVNLDSWPLAPFELINIASLNLEIGIINNIKKLQIQK